MITRLLTEKGEAFVCRQNLQSIWWTDTFGIVRVFGLFQNKYGDILKSKSFYQRKMPFLQHFRIELLCFFSCINACCLRLSHICNFLSTWHLFQSNTEPHWSCFCSQVCLLNSIADSEAVSIIKRNGVFRYYCSCDYTVHCGFLCDYTIHDGCLIFRAIFARTTHSCIDYL